VERFAEWVKRRGKPAVAVVFILTLIFGYFVPKVGVNSDLISFLPQNDPVVKVYKEIGEKFGGNTLVLVIIESDSIFSYHVLSTIKKLEDAYKEIEGVGFTQSLVSMIDIKKIEDGIEVGNLIEGEIPEDKKELERLKEYVMGREMYRGAIVSEDGRYTAIMIKVLEGYDRMKVGEEIIKTTEKLKGDLRTYYGGLPAVMHFVNKMITGDIKKLMPITIVLVMIVLFLGFHTGAGVFLPLLCVLIATVWSVGLMSITGVDLSLVSNIMPVLLISIGSAYGIHVINRFYEEKDIVKTIKTVGKPVIMAGATTLAGFLSFLTADMRQIREFGLFSGLGVLFALMFSIIIIPTLLGAMHIRKKKEVKHTVAKRFMDSLSLFVVRREKVIIAVAFTLAIASIAGIPRITRAVNLTEYFRPESEVRKANEIVLHKFGGSNPVVVDVKGDIRSPETLIYMFYLEKKLRGLPHAVRSRSIASMLAEVNYNLNGIYAVPETRDRVDNLWFFLEGQDILSMMVDDEEKEATIEVAVGTDNTGEIRKVVAEAEKILRTPPRDIAWEMLEEDAKRCGIEVKKEMLQVEPPPLTGREVKKYLESSEAMIELPPYLKNKVIKLSLRRDFEGIKKLLSGYPPEDVEYLIEDIEVRLEDEERENKIDAMYANITGGRKLSFEDEKRIKGDLYYFTVELPSISSPQVIQTGFPRIQVRLDRKLLKNQIQSLVIALFLVFLMILWQLRSLQGSLFSLIPIVFTILLNFGLMAYLKIPLDNATMMIASLAIGMGIDYAIHFTHRFREEHLRGKSLKESLKRTLETTGVAIMVNAISVTMGFLALLGGSLIPLVRFGMLVSFTMLVSSLSAVMLLPAILLYYKPSYIERR